MRTSFQTLPCCADQPNRVRLRFQHLECLPILVLFWHRHSVPEPPSFEPQSSGVLLLRRRFVKCYFVQPPAEAEALTAREVDMENTE